MLSNLYLHLLFVFIITLVNSKYKLSSENLILECVSNFIIQIQFAAGYDVNWNL